MKQGITIQRADQQSILFQPLEETFFNSMLNSFRQKVLRQQQQPTQMITLQQASSICNSMAHQSDVQAMSELSSKDFLEYLQEIKQEYIEYRRLQCEDNSDDSPENLDEMVVNCYKDVPQYYFEQPYRFNYGIFGQGREIINKYMEEATHYLDYVEITLFFQINSRFDQFLSVVLNLNDMNGLIDQNINKVQKLRGLYADARLNVVKKSREIIDKKQAIEKVEMTLFNMKLLQSAQKSLTQLAELITNQKYEQAVKLIKATEQTYQKLKTIQSLKNYPQKLNALQSHLQSSLTSHLLSLLLTQITQQIIPTKVLLHQLGQINDHDDSVLLVNSFVNDSWCDQSLNGNQQKPLDDNFIKLILCAYNIIDLSDKLFRNKVIEELQGYYQEFLLQIRDFLSKETEESVLRFDEQQVFESITSMMDDIPQHFYLRLINFFVENIKKMIIIQISTTQTIARVLKDTPKAVEIIDEFYAIPVAMLKLATEKIALILSSKRPDCQIKEFIELLNFYKSWETFFKIDVAKLTDDLNLFDDRIQLKIRNNFAKCSINQMIFMRAAQEKAYLQNYHKEKTQQLVKYLENELWVASDIAFDNYEIISYLMNIEEKENMDLDESVLLNTSVAGGRQILQQLVNNSVFKIVKTEIIILKDNSKYRVTQAFLFFLQLIYSYIKLFENFSTLTSDQISKLLELLKTYNSLSTQLILGAGAVHFGKITTITAKNLAISSVCLRTFEYLFDFISLKLTSIVNQLPQNEYINGGALTNDLGKIKADYLNHNNEITMKLTTILSERFNKQFEDIAKLDWNDQQARITIPSKFTNQIIQNTRSLYVAVEDILLAQDMKMVFHQILTLLINDFLLVFEQFTVTNKIGFTRVKEELEYFLVSLKEIGALPTLLMDVYDNLEKKIKQIIEDKPFKQ